MKKHLIVSLYYAALLFTLSMRYVFPVIGYIKTRLNVKFLLYLKMAGLASRNIVHFKKTFYVVPVSVFIFFEKLDNFC